jgi:Holliday junction resolvasome RuvABC endonuclease subunit
MTTYYVGIDPSIQNTGLVILRDNCRLYGWYESSTLVNKKLLQHKILRYSEIAHSVLHPLFGVIDIDSLVVCYEDYSFDSTNKAYSLGELGGILKSYLFRGLASIPIKLYLVPPTTLKLFATEYGGATKEMMQEAFIGDLNAPNEVPSNDIIDAYYLAEMACYISKKYPTYPERSKLEVIKNYLRTAKGIINKL